MTRTQLKRLSAQVFRGDKIKIAGHVLATRSPISKGIVRILLLDLQKKRVVRVLGKVATDSDGKFTAELVMPKALSPGQWQVVAHYMGSPSYAPSVSE
ncbi:MAG TPA: hypothetical protein EYN66_11595 [Myxococcales bacterium]|nr:hypothetical protein [Myxococcales bacterium]